MTKIIVKYLIKLLTRPTLFNRFVNIVYNCRKRFGNQMFCNFSNYPKFRVSIAHKPKLILDVKLENLNYSLRKTEAKEILS